MVATPALRGDRQSVRRFGAIGPLRAPVALAALLALTACASYQPAPIDPAASATQFIARRLDGPDLRDRVAALIPEAAATWPPKAWNRAQLLAAALVLNPDVGVARAQVDAALAHEITAGQRPNPELSLQTEYARHDPHPWLYGIGIDLLLQGSERRHLDAELARLQTGSARWRLMDEAWSVRRALVAALSARAGAQRRGQLLDRLLADQERLVAIVQRRVRAGESAAPELAAAAQARTDLEQQRARARADGVAAQAALAAALGVAPSALDAIAIDWPEWGAPPDVAEAASQAAREQALRARSDLGVAIDAYAEAENRLHDAVLRQYPQVHIAPGYYWDHGVAKFPLSASFDLPLFHHGQGEIAEAHAARDVAGARLLAVQAGIIGSIDAAQRAEAGARASVDAAERGVDTARAQRSNAAAALRLGAIAADEDLAADSALLRAELEALQLRAQWQAARDALEDALHAPLSGPELQLAQPLPVALTGANR